MNSLKNINGNNSLLIRELTGKDTLSIQNIWKECFTTDLNYINNFIQHCFPYSKSWGLFLNNSNNAVAMISALPSYSIWEKSTEKKVKIDGLYIYGLGTLREHRNKGYSALLMNEATIYAQKSSLNYIILKPAEESLYTLYRKHSFENNLTCYLIEIDISKKENKENLNSYNSLKDKEASLKRVSFKTILEQNNNHLKNRESLARTNFLWPDQILQYSLMEIKSRGGNTKYSQKEANLLSESSLTKKRDKTPLFYSSYLDESNASTVKVIDHNILSEQDLKSVINNLTSQNNLLCKIIFEFPTTTNLAIFSDYVHQYTIINSGLIKLLTPDNSMREHLLKLHLTLSME